MKLFFHYCSYGFSNCYILGAENSPKGQQNVAIIIDPGSMENVTLETIEDNNFDLKAVLITHEHVNHVQGLRTLKRIYNAGVIAVNQNIMDHKTTRVKDGDKLVIGGFTAEVISIPGHSSDSVVYKIGDLLFTGDVLTAGLVGSTASAYGMATQMNKLRSRVLSLPGDYVVLPGHGPPSTLEAERRFNAAIFNYDQSRTKRPVFKVDI
ncbi:MAG: MBL fold metallo-hydrolase [Treponema sp.]|jgi:glyoxylase-like metal-dependent hydrolase (beta-lactamase superfamily II)|nr:MBL fold metallo-hydrolase [Treponema sp.]